MSFLGLGEKNYATIVGPLKKMTSDLAAYKIEQSLKIEEIDIQISELEQEKSVSTSEIGKSDFTSRKIDELMASDLDDNGIADVDELPDDTEEDPPV